MNEPGKSDRSEYCGSPRSGPEPREEPFKGGNFWDYCEWMYGDRSFDKGNDLAEDKADPAQQGDWTQRHVSSGDDPAAQALPNELERIRQAACRDKRMRFTSLWHHVYNPARLREAYLSLKRQAAPGEDGRTWGDYGKDLEANLRDLSERLARGTYHARPVLRVYIPKSDGRQRPIGIPAIEDKIVQRATVAVLESVWEQDFLGFSYGFRPGRSAHRALDALAVGLKKRKVSWILDADIRGFFDTLDHEWLIKFVEHRIADRRVIRHIRKWLNAGVLEEGRRQVMEQGTPQGGSISPLLANLYLHHVLDLWAEQWRRKRARGDVIIVRYADDFVVGFQHESDARRFLGELRERFSKFNLELHAEKTRVIEFGRFAAGNRARRGEGRPETFNFLGFTHVCGKTRKGWFSVGRRTIAKRMRSKLAEVRDHLRRRMHWPVGEVGQWLRMMLQGHYRYYGVPGNVPMLDVFRHEIRELWRRMLSRRSQKGYITQQRMDRIAARWLPRPRVCHPYPGQRQAVKI